MAIIRCSDVSSKQVSAKYSLFFHVSPQLVRKLEDFCYSYSAMMRDKSDIAMFLGNSRE
jgi:hypothetical protein